MSLPGPVHHHPDVVKPSAILPGWPGVTGDDFAVALGVPVSIDNDANLAALGEHIWGAGQGCADCITVKFHYGIGCGLFVNGTLVRGIGGAGEIGHTCVDQRGPLCRCGKRGCVDTYAAIPAMLDALRPQHGALTLPGLMTLLADRDPGAIRVVSDAAELVGEHLAAACHLLAPQRVVLVGAMAEAGELVLGPIRAALERNIAPNQPPDLVRGTLGTRHTALGAVALALGESNWLPGWPAIAKCANFCSYEGKNSHACSVPGQAASRIVLPTLFWMKAVGSWRAMAWVAFQPVQCAGTSTSGLRPSSALTVSGMMGSKAGPDRWKPPMTACRAGTPVSRWA